MKLRLSIAIFILLFCAKNIFAQSDSVIIQKDTIFLPTENNKQATKKVNYTTTEWRPNPKKAVLWAIIPGGGQIYNRKYWKLPLIYGGGLGLYYGFAWSNEYYQSYLQAYAAMYNFMRDEAYNRQHIESLLPPGQNIESYFAVNDKNRFFAYLGRNKDAHRRNRDLCIIGAAGIYALTFLDAFVDAQLFDFDISPDLTMSVYPVLDMTMPNNAAVGLQMQFKF